MPIQTPNGILPKRSRLGKSTLSVTVSPLHDGIAASQHGTTAISDTSYNSPFTPSGKPLFNATNDNAQQIQLAPMKVESAGDVVPAMDFIKVHPWEKGTHFSTTASKQHALIARKGGPDPKSDTPSHPDDLKNHMKARPVLKASSDEIAKANFFPSFLRSGGTIGGHVDPQAGTSSGTSRWATVKKGVVVA